MTGGMLQRIVGSPQTVVDELEKWVVESDVDGFNLAHVVIPGSFDDMIEFLLPELRRLELSRSEVEKPGATAREAFLGQAHVLDDHPACQLRWTKR